MDNTFENQEKAILAHLEKGESITQLEALKQYNCMRLSDRIFRLRKQGYPIKTELVSSGKKTFAKYKIDKN